MTMQNRKPKPRRTAAHTRPTQRRPGARRFGLRRRSAAALSQQVVAAFRAHGHGVDPRTAFERSRVFYLGTPESRLSTTASRASATGSGDISLSGRGISRVFVILGVGLVGLGYALSIAQIAGIA